MALAGCGIDPRPREDVAQPIDVMESREAGRQDAPQDVGRDDDVALFDAVADGAMDAADASDVLSEPVCRPGEARCAATGTREVCAADGQQFLAAPCPMAQICLSGSCVARLCVPLSTRCAGPTSIETCSVDGTSYGPVSACAPGFGCNSMTNTCAPFACTPGNATGCTSVTARAVCGADGQAASAVECAPGESCAMGVCRARVCSPGATRCAGSGSVETCALDGLSWSAEACGARRSCSGGACASWLCTPGESRCASSGSSEACSADGLSFQSPMPCGAGESCGSASGRCDRWLCAPGTATCVGNVRRGCNADGLGTTDIACGSRTSCVGAGMCAPWICEPGSFTCASLLERRVCAPDGLSQVSASCPAMNACLGAGMCTPWMCTPGSSTSCASLSARAVCNPDGQGTAADLCAAGESCSAGACHPRLCTPGATRCAGSTETCSIDGLSWSAAACGAARLDGTSDGIVIPGSAGISTPSMTMSIWVRLRSTSVQPLLERKTRDAGGSLHGFNFNQVPCLGHFSSRFYVDACAPGACSGANFIDLCTTDTRRPGWNHLLATYDAATGRATLFLNGVMQGSAIRGTGLVTEDPLSPIGVGVDLVGDMVTSSRANADIADVTLLDHAATAGEVSALYSGTFDRCSALASWRLNEGAGTTVRGVGVAARDGSSARSSWVSDGPNCL